MDNNNSTNNNIIEDYSFLNDWKPDEQYIDNSFYEQLPHGSKHKYPASVATHSTTKSRKPPAQKKRREQDQQQQPIDQQDQLQLQLQATHLFDDDDIYINSIIGLPKHEEFGPGTSPSSFEDSGISSQDEHNHIWTTTATDKDKVPILDTIIALEQKIKDLELSLKEKEMELSQYQQHVSFPVQYIKECARQAFQNKYSDELTEETIKLYLLQPSSSKSNDILSLPLAIGRFQQEWNKYLGKKSSPTEKKKMPVAQSSNNHQEKSYQPGFEKLSNCGSAIYISAASTSSNPSMGMALPAAAPRQQMTPSNLNQKIDNDARWTLIEQYLNGYNPQVSSNSTAPVNNNNNANNSGNSNNNNNPSASINLVDGSVNNSDTMVTNVKLSEAEKVTVKEAARQCFMCFDGKMIIESEGDRLEYLQEHCSLPPSSLSAAVECFKLELEKVRNKTKKQLLRFQNYNTEKWDQPIEKVCYLILGKDRWEKLSAREKTLITGKYAYLRTNLEDLKKRNAKIKWDKLQDDFERHIKGYENNWIGLCGYWINNDQSRFEQRKRLEGHPASSSSSSSPSSSSPTTSNNIIISSNNNDLIHHQHTNNSTTSNINLCESNLPTPMSTSSPATHIPSMNTPLTPSLSVITEQDFLNGNSPCLDPYFS